jgi:hypothetical protein
MCTSSQESGTVAASVKIPGTGADTAPSGKARQNAPPPLNVVSPQVKQAYSDFIFRVFFSSVAQWLMPPIC